MEIWKPINDERFAGLYEVSDHGNVRNAMTKRVLTPHICPNGYKAVQLTGPVVRTKVENHRCVARAFLGNPAERHICNHRDGNKLNNHISNLEWVTYRDNLLHAYRNGLRTKWGGRPLPSLSNRIA